MNKLRLIRGGDQSEKFDSLLYWLATAAELEEKEFSSLDEGLNHVITLVVDKFGNNDAKSRKEEINFLKLVFETDELLLEQLAGLLKIKNSLR